MVRRRNSQELTLGSSEALNVGGGGGREPRPPPQPLLQSCPQIVGGGVNGAIVTTSTARNGGQGSLRNISGQNMQGGAAVQAPTTNMATEFLQPGPHTCAMAIAQSNGQPYSWGVGQFYLFLIGA